MDERKTQEVQAEKETDPAVLLLPADRFRRSWLLLLLQ